MPVEHIASRRKRFRKRISRIVRLRHINQSLRHRLKEYRRLMFVAGAAAIVLGFSLGFVLLRESSPVLLGAGRAGVRTITAGVGGSLAPAQPPEPKSGAEMKAPPASPDSSPGQKVGSGEASYYGNEVAGNPTASGERFNPDALTAAHRTLPLGSRVRVTNVRNGKSVVVRINDRGPYAKRRVIDLSRAAAGKIGMLSRGIATVRLELLR